jgi:hypothetical protein
MVESCAVIHASVGPVQVQLSSVVEAACKSERAMRTASLVAAVLDSDELTLFVTSLAIVAEAAVVVRD